MKKMLAWILLFFSTTIFASPPDSIIFFGDSLSDNGNIYHLLFKIIPRSPPYYLGRFTNGPTWAEHISKFYYDKYYIGSKIYAYGGAAAVWHSPTVRFTSPITLGIEIDKYLIESFFKYRNKTLFSIWVGGNDYLFDRKTDPDIATTNVVNSIAGSLNKLIRYGGRKFLVINLPDLGTIPFARITEQVERLKYITRLHNQKLATAIADLKAANPDVEILFINIFDLYNDIIAFPEKYNEKYHTHVRNTFDACWQGGYLYKRNGVTRENLVRQLQKAAATEHRSFDKYDPYNQFEEIDDMADYILDMPELAEAYRLAESYLEGRRPCDNAEEYLFWDSIHPSGVVHEILGKIIAEKLVATFNV